MLFDDEPFRVAVFGSTYDVRHDGMCTVYWGGQRKTYTRRITPVRESAVDMQKRIEEDITEEERKKVCRVARVWHASTRFIFSAAPSSLAGRASSSACS